jgi:oligoendopeptidase F
MSKKIKTWNLNDIFKENEFEIKLAEVKKEIDRIDQWVKKLDPKMKKDEFKKLMEFGENLGEKFSRLAYLPGLMEAADQKNKRAKEMKSKVDLVAIELSRKMRVIGFWLKGIEQKGIKKLDDKKAKELFAVIPDLEYNLNYSREAAKYNLKIREEEIVDNKDLNGVGVLTDLREMIEMDLEYKVDGKIIKTQAELTKLFYSNKAKVREGAYKSMFMTHKKEIDKFFAIYQAVVRDWDYEAKIRGYKSPISMRNFGNQVNDEVIENLLAAVKEKRGVFQKFFEYKAKLLKVKKLKRFDLYAPKPGEVKEKEYKFEEAVKIVLEVFGEFNVKWREAAEKILKEEHVEVWPRINKTNGAFCATVSPKISPYVLLNHTGSLRDVFTLAHELGHGIHSLLANKHYPSSQSANLPLAETASTLAETILFEKILTKEKDKEKRKSMLWSKMADSYATIMRQNYFVLFEIEAHEMISRGSNEKELAKLWLENLKHQFGKSVEVDKVFGYEWSYISHIVNSPFYCYAYNFGELLALSIYAEYKEKGNEVTKKVNRILAAGGSEDPIKLLKVEGFEVDKKEFWEKGFEVIEQWQRALEKV